MNIKKLITNLDFIVFGLASAALLGFMIYVAMRQGGAQTGFQIGQVLNTSVLENLSLLWMIFGFLLGFGGLSLSLILRPAMLAEKEWAKPITGMILLASIGILAFAWGEIKEIEGAHFEASAYRKMFMYGAVPMMFMTAVLPFGLARKKPKQPTDTGKT